MEELLGTLLSSGLKFLGQSQANAQNMQMNTGAWKAEQVQQEASQLGVSPLAVLGNTGSVSPMQNVAGDVGISMGQNTSRAAAASSPHQDRMDALTEQNMVLRNAQLQNDVVAQQARNSVQRSTYNSATPPAFTPAPLTLDDVWGAVHPGQLAPKASIQPFRRPGGGYFYGPAAAVQQSLWSPIPGLPANPQIVSDVTRMNAQDMPPDVARMSGLPPGAYHFLPGTAPSWGERYLWSPEAAFGRDDPSIYGR